MQLSFVILLYIKTTYYSLPSPLGEGAGVRLLLY